MVFMRNKKNDPLVIIKYPLLYRALVLMKGHIYTCNDEANKKKMSLQFIIKSLLFPRVLCNS